MLRSPLSVLLPCLESTQKKERKKNALLAGLSAKALTPSVSTPLLVSGTREFLQVFFFAYKHIYFFETSTFRNAKMALKKIKNVT